MRCCMGTSSDGMSDAAARRGDCHLAAPSHGDLSLQRSITRSAHGPWFSRSRAGGGPGLLDDTRTRRSSGDRTAHSAAWGSRRSIDPGMLLPWVLTAQHFCAIMEDTQRVLSRAPSVPDLGCPPATEVFLFDAPVSRAGLTPDSPGQCTLQWTRAAAPLSGLRQEPLILSVGRASASRHWPIAQAADDVPTGV